jgi:hypothetical protein
MAEKTEKNKEDLLFLKNMAANGQTPHYCIRFRRVEHLFARMAEMTEKNLFATRTAKPEKSKEDLRCLRNLAADGQSPHYCAGFDHAELVLKDRVLNENHISATSPLYGAFYEENLQVNLPVTHVTMGKRNELDGHADWSIVELFLKCTPMGIRMPPDFCVHVGFPTSWSKKLYLSCLLALIEIEDSCLHSKEDTNRFVLHNTLSIGGKLYYTVGTVEKLFNTSIPGLNLVCKRSSEIVEKYSEETYPVTSVYHGYEDCMQADLGKFPFHPFPP